MEPACSENESKRKHEPSDESEQKRAKGEETEKTEAEVEVSDEQKSAVKWTEFRAENLDCDYCRLYRKEEADRVLKECDEKLIYNTGELTKVYICGKWQGIPRQQVCDSILYKFGIDKLQGFFYRRYIYVICHV